MNSQDRRLGGRKPGGLERGSGGWGSKEPVHGLGRFPPSIGLRATELAAYSRITKQSMGYLVDQLQAGGYVERVADPIDGRAKAVRLTLRGWEAIQVIHDAVRRVEDDWGRRIGAERVEQLRGILRDLVASLER